jgi:signal transduction histidine kinase
MNVDLRQRTSLFCGALAIAIAASILLRRRPRLPQLWFAGFAGDVGLWYLAQWQYHFVRGDGWARVTAVLAVLLPQFALRLFEALMPESERRSTLPRTASILLPPVALLAIFGPLEHWWVRGAVFLYVCGLLGAGLASLWARSGSLRSRPSRRRVRFMVILGALAVAATLADFLWFLDVILPPIGAAFSVLFLFVISESLIRQRFVDVYDVLGQVLLSTALSSCLAAIFYVFVGLFGGFDTMYLAAFLATIVILVVFEPLREKTNSAIHRAFFRERAVLERAVQRVRAELVHVLQLDEMASVIVAALEESRRATGVAVYLRDPAAPQFELRASFGPGAPPTLPVAKVELLLERLATQPSLVLDDVELAADEARRDAQLQEVALLGRLLAAAEVLGEFRRAVVLPIRGRRLGLGGLILVADDRAVEAFSTDEVPLLEELALHASVVLENSEQHRHLQARDRLAVLGQMAAGLAHEVKNPLGAIKGAAQLLEGDAALGGTPSSEFLQIILEEVDRLDRVVGSVLDYARPQAGKRTEVRVQAVVQRTVQVLAAEGGGSTLVVEEDEELPTVLADPEQLRQVLINLVRNAVQAMAGRGTVRIRLSRVPPAEAPSAAEGGWLAVSVSDQGPGIDPEVQKSLFVPFVTTKQRGTGLGLAISQRIVQELGGRIEVSSQLGAGTTFRVLLPGRASPAFTPTPPPEDPARARPVGSSKGPDGVAGQGPHSRQAATEPGVARAPANAR